jgi:hypothetical protein
VIIERNLFTAPNGTSPGTQIITAVSHDLVIRNNLAVYQGSGPAFFVSIGNGNTAYSVAPCTRAYIENNTLYCQASLFTFVGSDNLQSPSPDNPSGITLVNNLVYDPIATMTGFNNSPSGLNGYMLYYTYAPDPFSLTGGNSTDSQIVGANPGWSPSAGAVNSQGFGFPTANYTQGQGVAVALWEDFNGNPRTGANDQGAFGH